MSRFDVELQLQFANVGSGETVSFWSYIVAAGEDRQTATEWARMLLETHFKKFAPQVLAFQIEVVSVKAAPEGCPATQLEEMGPWTFEVTQREPQADSGVENYALFGENFWSEFLDRLTGVFADFVREHPGDPIMAFGAETDFFNGDLSLCATLGPIKQKSSAPVEWTHQNIEAADAEWMEWWGCWSRRIQSHFSQLGFSDADTGRDIFMRRLVRSFLIVQTSGVFRVGSLGYSPTLHIIDHEDSQNIAVERVVRERVIMGGKV